MKNQLRTEDLAERSGVAPSTAIRLEHRRSFAYGATVKRIATALRIDPEQLLTQPVVRQAEAG